MSLLLLAPGLGAQTPEESPARLVERAHAAREAGDFPAAAALVVRYLSAVPDDGGSWWLLGQLRFWSGDAQGARVAYRRALALMPDDHQLRLDFGRMLVGVGWLSEAGRVVAPTLAGGSPEERAEAERILADVRALTPPWLLARLLADHDDQPRTVLGLEAEAGRYLTPAWTVAARVAPRSISLGDLPGDGGGSRTRVGFRAATGLSSPDGTLSLSAAAGGVAGGGVTEAVYLGATSLRLAGGVSLVGEVERAAYEWTPTSLDSLLMTTRLEVALDGGAGLGWAGALHLRQERFADGNRIATAFGWLLAPVLPGVRVGYALSWQDADSSRWVRDPDGGGGPGAPPGRADTIPGRYAPYHTPDDLVVHTVLVEGSGAVGGATLRGQVGVGVWATEEAPVLVRGTGSQLVLAGYTRSFNPWYATLSLRRPLGSETELELSGELRESSYYRLGRLSAGVVKRWR